MTLLCIIPGPDKELHREPAGVKWCFRCRKRLPHDWKVLGNSEPSYYDPVGAYECSGCKSDCTRFPGTGPL